MSVPFRRSARGAVVLGSACLAALALLVLAAPETEASHTGYTWIGPTIPGVSSSGLYSFETGGTFIATPNVNGFGSYRDVDFPSAFEWDFYGDTYSGSKGDIAYVGADGLIGIDTPWTGDSYNQLSAWNTVPNPGQPNGFLAPFFTNQPYTCAQYVGGGPPSWRQSYQTGGAHPRWIISWYDSPIQPNGANGVCDQFNTYQVKMFESTDIVEYHYARVDNYWTAGVSFCWNGMVGLENKPGTAALARWFLSDSSSACSRFQQTFTGMRIWWNDATDAADQSIPCAPMGTGTSIPLGTSNDPLYYYAPSGPTSGTLAGYPTGDVASRTRYAPITVTYTPYAAGTPAAWDGYGTDSVTYSVTDGHDGRKYATVEIKVNAPPVANNSTRVVDVGTSDNVLFVLANDSDAFGSYHDSTWADEDDLLIVDVEAASKGTPSIAADGKSLTYTPDPGASGTDSFNYTISDGCPDSTATAEVTVHINEPPEADPDTYYVEQDSVDNDFGVLGNDTDAFWSESSGPVASPTVNITALDGGASPASTSLGTATIAEDKQSILYTPDAGQSGTDSFTYTVSDGRLQSTATVTVIIETAVDEDPPTWDDNALTATAMSETQIDLAWTAATDNEAVTSYNVYCSTTSGFTPGSGNLVAQGLGAATTSFPYTNLAPWTDYYCIVRAFDDAGLYADSNEATDKTWDVTPPGTVTDLAAGNPTTSTIRLTWTAPSDNVAVTGYEVYCDTSAGFTPGSANLVADDVGASATSYQVTFLDPDTTYFCVIRAYDEAGNYADHSNIASETTTSDQPESGIPDPSISTLVASPDQIDVDTGSSTVTLTLYDTNGDPITDTDSATSLAVGKSHACAALAAGTVRCWGSNSEGQLGDGTQQNASVPVKVAEIDSVVSLAAGMEHTCGLRTDASVWCWGANSKGQLGDGQGGQEDDRSLAPVQADLPAPALALTTGGSHTCALLTDGSVWCWGSNFRGQLGDGTDVDRLTPVIVEGLPDGAARIGSGNVHTCAVLSDGTAWCWGWNYLGQLGNGEAGEGMDIDFHSSEPVQVSGLAGAVGIAGGAWHTCAYRDDGTAACWGKNEGQLGDDGQSGEQSSTPVEVAGIVDAVGIAAGDVHSCAVRADGNMACWGDNGAGKLGDGTDTSRAAPVPVQGIAPDVITADAGIGSTCGLFGSGQVFCWGDNYHGQLGDGTTDDSTSPRQVEHLYAAIGISTDFGTLDPVRPTDNGDGTYTTTLTCSAADEAKLTATIDGEDVDDEATVECVVPDDNTPPEANDDPDYTTPFETTLSVSDPDDGVLFNDEDDDDDTLTAHLVTGPTKEASFTLDDDGTFEYTPDAGETGVDTFTYRVEDGNGGSDEATATITIGDPPGDDPPVADDKHVDVDEDDDPIAVTLTAAGSGQLDFALSGPVPEGLDGDAPDLTYEPPDDLCTPDEPVSFYFKATDAAGQMDTGVVTINVECKSDLPVAVDDTATVQGGRSVEIDVLLNDRHPDAPYDAGATLMLDSVDAASASGATVTVVAGKVVYEALDRFVPTYVDTFSYMIVDGDDQTVEGKVRVTVTPPPSQVRPPPSYGGGGGAPAASPAKSEVVAEPDPVPDTDRDGILDDVDNCIEDPNADQVDSDADDVGDACDTDRDGDGWSNEADNCPDTPNGAQQDLDGDGVGDVCDPDRDGDGVDQRLPRSNALLDNCPDARNPAQTDSDEDGIGDACDSREDTLETTPSRPAPGAALEASAPVADARSVPVLAVGLGIVLMVAVGILVVTWTMKAAGRDR